MSAAEAVTILAYRELDRLPRGAWERLEHALTESSDCRTRSAALTVIASRKNRARTRRALETASHDPHPAVRRRVGELAEHQRSALLIECLLTLLDDPDTDVAHAAAGALGECARTQAARDRAIPALAFAATTHTDALVREASIAALGALGDKRGLPAILAGCTDKPAIRRRAVLALAAFSGPEVDEALARARNDRDWQTRQAAELLAD